MKYLTTILLMLALSTMIQAQDAKNVYSPEQGVICDKKSHFCVDSFGISMGFTKDFLGQKSVDKFMKMTDNLKDLDTTIFTFSNGLNCDTNKKICKKSKWDEKKNVQWTQILFGK